MVGKSIFSEFYLVELKTLAFSCSIKIFQPFTSLKKSFSPSIPKLINVNHKNAVANFLVGNLYFFDKIAISDEIYLIGRMRLRGRLDRNPTPILKFINGFGESFVQYFWETIKCVKVPATFSSRKRQICDQQAKIECLLRFRIKSIVVLCGSSPAEPSDSTYIWWDQVYH